MQSRLAPGIATILLLLSQAPLSGQLDRRDRRLPLGPNRPAGEGVAPVLESWYANPDGTYTVSFGYFNFNTEETIEIPIGPDNRIEPAEFDGMQPTHFSGPRMGYERHESGVFTVTVPGHFAEAENSVVWTLTAHGETHRLVASVGKPALQMDYGPRALGSVPPLLRFAEDGPRGQNPMGITLHETLTVSVGEPLEITVWVEDPSERDPEILGPLFAEVPIGVTWFLHRGPVGAPVSFERVGEPWPAAGDTAEGEDRVLPPTQHRVAPIGGSATARVTFGKPGDYTIRVRADNFGANDSQPDIQCCWTNGFVDVTVVP